LGQLLVVARHTLSTSTSSCYELGLIPDPLRTHCSFSTRWIWDQWWTNSTPLDL